MMKLGHNGTGTRRDKEQPSLSWFHGNGTQKRLVFNGTSWDTTGLVHNGTSWDTVELVCNGTIWDTTGLVHNGTSWDTTGLVHNGTSWDATGLVHNGTTWDTAVELAWTHNYGQSSPINISFFPKNRRRAQCGYVQFSFSEVQPQSW